MKMKFKNKEWDAEITTEGVWYMGNKIEVTFNGKTYTRTVHDDHFCGLYITMYGMKYFMYEFE